jgi:signal transduction histidine kinase
MRQRFREWTESLDPELRRAISDPGAWVFLAVIIGAILALCGYVERTRVFFQLDWRPPLALFVPPFLIGIAGGFAERRRRLSARRFGAIALLDSTLFQAFGWSLVAYSQRPGSLLLAGFPALLVAYHGHAHQASVRYPFQLFTSVVALAAGLLMTRDPEKLGLIAVVGGVSIGIAALLGSVSQRRDSDARERASLREAVNAQILEARARESELYREMVLQLRAHSHDAGNTLSSVLINVESLLRSAGANGTSPFAEDAREIAEDLRTALLRLSAIIAGAREVGARDNLPRQEVSPAAVLPTTVRSLGSRFPRTRFHLPPPKELPPSASVYGGETALHRILVNLLANACEGDGRVTATNVWARASIEAEGHLVFTVEDDGPGFSPEQLAGGVEVFETKKPNGSGLGLYTVGRLVAANQGVLTRENRNEGGARVRVALPLGSGA